MSISEDELRVLRHKAALWDDFMAAKQATAREPDDTEWKRLARANRPIEAIKACRAAHGIGLWEAKDCVEGYQAQFRSNAAGATP